jgi:hypothetical protein
MAKIQIRRDTLANWVSKNPVLSQGELGLDLTTNRLKIGDGVKNWASLAYFSTGTVDSDWATKNFRERADSDWVIRTIKSLDVDSDWILRQVNLNRVDSDWVIRTIKRLDVDSDWITRNFRERADSDWVIRTIKRLDVDSDWVTSQIYTKAQSDSDLNTKTKVSNTFYVQTGVGNKFNAVIAQVGTLPVREIVFTAGGHNSGSTTTINGAGNLSITGPSVPSGSPAATITEAVTITGASSTRIRFSNISFDGVVTINGTLGRHVFKGCSFNAGFVFTGGTSNFVTFEDCTFNGFTLNNTFAGLIYHVRSAFSGVNPTLNQSLPQQVIFTDCSGFVSFPTNALLYANNALTTAFTRWTGNELRINGKMVNGNVDSDWVIRTSKRLDVDSDWILRQISGGILTDSLYATYDNTSSNFAVGISNGALVSNMIRTSGNIELFNSNGFFRLATGKTYRIDMGFKINETSGTGTMKYGLFNSSKNAYYGDVDTLTAASKRQGSISYTVTPTSPTDTYCILFSGVSGTQVTYTPRNNTDIYIGIAEVTAAVLINSKVDSEWVLANGGIQSRETKSVTVPSLANNATANATITGFSAYHLLKITTNGPAWVRVYADTASRTADASRLQGVDPAPGAGVIAEAITTNGSLSALFAPGVLGFSNESTPNTNIPITVTNRVGSQASIIVSMDLIRVE